jgi:hypothetical protein
VPLCLCVYVLVCAFVFLYVRRDCNVFLVLLIRFILLSHTCTYAHPLFLCACAHLCFCVRSHKYHTLGTMGGSEKSQPWVGGVVSARWCTTGLSKNNHITYFSHLIIHGHSSVKSFKSVGQWESRVLPYYCQHVQNQVTFIFNDKIGNLSFRLL